MLLGPVRAARLLVVLLALPSIESFLVRPIVAPKSSMQGKILRENGSNDTAMILILTFCVFLLVVPMQATRGVIIDPDTVPRIETKIQARPDAQKVFVIGSGAVGLTYGARLLESGHHVTFLMRRDYDTTMEKVCKCLIHLGRVHFVGLLIWLDTQVALTECCRA